VQLPIKRQVPIWIFKTWFRSTCYDWRNWDIVSLMFTFMLGWNKCKYYLASACIHLLNTKGKLDMSPLICVSDKVWIIELTLIHNNIRSVHNLTRMCMFIYQSDVKHIMRSPIKIITSVSSIKILSTYTFVVILGIIMCC
jgi:hypothetical protein